MCLPARVLRRVCALRSPAQATWRPQEACMCLPALACRVPSMVASRAALRVRAQTACAGDLAASGSMLLLLQLLSSRLYVRRSAALA